MKKKFNIFIVIFYVFAIILSLFNFNAETNNYKFNSINNNTINKAETPNNPENEINSYLWGGLSLQYFIYKHSDIKENEVAKNLYDRLMIDNKNDLTEDFFYMGLMAPIINISLYGLTSYREYFAEAYSKWTTTEDSAKNKSWEIVNYYFLNIYPVLKNNTNGLFDWITLKSKVELDLKDNNSNNLIYKTNLNSSDTNMNANDLGYNNYTEIGYLATTNKLYSSNSVIFATESAFFQGNLGLNHNSVNNPILGNYLLQSKFQNGFNDIDYENISKFMYDTLNKASASSIEKFNFVKGSNDRMFKSFDEMDEFFKTNTKSSVTKSGSNIFLKEAIDAMSNYYSWSSIKTNLFKNQILDLMNFTFYITNWYSLGENEKDSFKYNLIAIIFSPDDDIVDGSGNNKGVMGYTSMAGQVNNSFGPRGIAYSHIVYNGAAFNLDSPVNEAKEQYTKNWWTSPNIFTTLNHEMGHSVDSFLGESSEFYNYIKSNFSSVINSNPIKEGENALYQGTVFGFDEASTSTSYILYVVLGLVVGLAIAGLLTFWFIRISKKTKSINPSKTN
ncbi:hypothetical protein [Spiroplasma turonicum]|uniref:Uncharacterized protein n=1 Tax=Spiroplasma turonicum TaxID=216946 RepID=A0A0K1P815_9MOLU|nr:hypothetical protein [Spiroplasma turonicum]AKU80012.1 hypothetical protein STURON_00766 [Spiroplasma turonicum]ALX71014.1 hypothetical protein STURO_v1c07630 [Spiroplasma turonicum]